MLGTILTVLGIGLFLLIIRQAVKESKELGKKKNK